MLITILQSLILYYTFASTLVLSKEISFRDSNIQYIGRWYSSSHQDQIKSGWPGAYFKVTLEQTRFIKLQLTQPTSLTVFINNVEFQFPNISHTEPLDLVPQGLMDDGPHDLIVVASQLDAYQVSICLQAILVDEAGTTVAIPEETPLVEFVGHDLILGAGTTRTLFSSFAWLTSRDLLHLDLSFVAYRNAKLVDGLEEKYFDWSLTSTNKAGKIAKQPWSVVILLGANDRLAGISVDDYRKALDHFVTNVRKTLNESTPIFILSELLGDMFRPSQQAVWDLTHKGDQYVYFIDTTSWIRYGTTYYLDSGHLNDVGHLLLAKKLAPLLEIKLTHPRDPLPGPPPNPNLPDDWQTMDVGKETRIGLPGTVSADSATTFTLWGSGADIDNDQDAFRFVYQPFGNQGIMESTIRSHSTFAKCAKAGIMIREHLGQGSPFIMLGISPAEGIFVQVRYGNFETTKLIKKMRASPPYRLRLVRQNDMFHAQIQHPSSSELPLKDTWQTFATVPFILSRDVYAGLAVTSCDTSVVSVAKFTEVAIYHSSSFSSLDSSTQARFIDQH